MGREVMPHSMTGFAAVDTPCAPLQLSWEIRSINHRFLDVTFRLPDDFRRMEGEYRKLVGDALSRGKIDCTLKVSLPGNETQGFEVGHETLAKLADLQSSLRRTFRDAAPLSVGELLRWPGVLKEVEPGRAELAQSARHGLEEALAALQQVRSAEGRRLLEMLEQRLESITALLEELRPLLVNAQERHREKLLERLRKIDVEVQPERLEQELAMIAQRLDVTEEVDRLVSHVAEVRSVLAQTAPMGRKLDFLIQELNREANTLASKAQDERMTRCAVELKVLIEQMREQAQNLE
jgi:uncharacterized protein (TIGR00255 family)